MRGVRGARLRLAGWCGLLLIAAALLHRLGDGPLAGPSLRDPGRWSQWVSTVDAPTATVALVRLVGEAMAWYLLVVTMVQVLAARPRVGPLGRILGRLAAPGARRVVAAAIGLGAASAGSVPSAGVPSRPVVVELASHRLSARHDLTRSGPADAPSGDPTPASPGPAGRAEPPGPTATMRVDDPPPPPPAAAPEPATRVVRPGDCFWSIAEEVVTGEGAPAAADASLETEVATYWRRLVDANRATLVDPANPDLLFAGQVLVLPPR